MSLLNWLWIVQDYSAVRFLFKIPYTFLSICFLSLQEVVLLDLCYGYIPLLTLDMVHLCLGQVYLVDKRGNSFSREAKIIGVDPAYDLAVLKVKEWKSYYYSEYGIIIILLIKSFLNLLTTDAYIIHTKLH